jgi:DNA-binding transcriptional LysR family regulator
VTGYVKITVPSAAATLVLARLLPAFLARHPRVQMDVCIDDHFVDIVSGGYAAGMRLVESIDRDMVHVRLSAACRVVVAGAPSYLERRGVPQKPLDLLQHEIASACGSLGVRSPSLGARTWQKDLARAGARPDQHERTVAATRACPCGRRADLRARARFYASRAARRSRPPFERSSTLHASSSPRSQRREDFLNGPCSSCAFRSRAGGLSF